MEEFKHQKRLRHFHLDSFMQEQVLIKQFMKIISQFIGLL